MYTVAVYNDDFEEFQGYIAEFSGEEEGNYYLDKDRNKALVYMSIESAETAGYRHSEYFRVERTDE